MRTRTQLKQFPMDVYASEGVTKIFFALFPCMFSWICCSSVLMIGLGLLSVLLSPVCHPDTEMKDEMEIVTDAIMVLLIEGEAKLSPP